MDSDWGDAYNTCKIEKLDSIISDNLEFYHDQVSTDTLAHIQQWYSDIEHQLLHFLENHDEQRIASPAFAGYPEKAKPTIVVSATISTSPTMIYFGQEVGEPGAEHAGFGSPTRTSIFDYVGVPHHQRWMNGGKFDGGQLTASERALRDFYKRLLNFTRSSPALMGAYADMHTWNRHHTPGYNEKLFSFVRWSKDQKLIVFSNFSDHAGFSGNLQVPGHIIKDWGLNDGTYRLKDELYGEAVATMQVTGGEGRIQLTLQPLESLILLLQ